MACPLQKFNLSCRAITEASAPSHPIPRGFAGPSLLAMVLVNKFLLHQPLMPEQRLAVRRERSRPLIAELEIWMRQQRALLSTKNDTAKAINYLLNRWAAFTRFLDDGRVCLTNNAAERALRGVAVGRRNWTFAGSDAGGHRAAAVYTLIETCKMNDVDPQAWLADVLARLPDHLANKVADLLPWNWKVNQQSKAAVAA